ncbi:MAG: serine/threonine-protein kinase [bacterium]
MRIADRYRLLRPLGQGGMAGIFLAHDEMLDRAVAIKQLHPELGDQSEVKARFIREARIIARLRHPNIVDIHDVVPLEETGGVAMVMEYIDGTDLSQLLRKMPVPCPELAALVLRPVAEALAYVHREGIIHRDIKPANVLLGRDGAVKLTDFGIARGDDDSGLTRTGDFLGTPAYIPPEQARGVRVTAAADQYALGVMLYQLVTGEKPFAARSTAEVVLAIIRGEYPDPRTRAPAVDDALAAVIHRAMAHEPGDRYPDVDAFIAALDACLPPVDADQVAAAVAGIVVQPESTTSEFARLRADEWELRAEEARARGDFNAAAHAERAAAARRGFARPTEAIDAAALGFATDATLVDARAPGDDDTMPSAVHAAAADALADAVSPDRAPPVSAVGARRVDPGAATDPPPRAASPRRATVDAATVAAARAVVSAARTVAMPPPGAAAPAPGVAGWKVLLVALVITALIGGGVTWFLLRDPPPPPAMDRAPPAP